MPNGSVSVKESETEQLKRASRGLYGPIAAGLSQRNSRVSDESAQILKHHGVYQQDDRDTRLERRKAGNDPDYGFMVRAKFPGGRLGADQYLCCDKLATEYGGNDLRVTSRQGLEFHGVTKANLRRLIHDLNVLSGVTTWAAAGDVVRNTVAPPVADIDPRYAKCGVNLVELAERIAKRFLPQSRAYFDLWVEDRRVAVNEDGAVRYPLETPEEPAIEPLYGPTYLPRKFKIAIATDFDNSVDVFANDVGILAATEDGRVEGYEIVVGGGLGFTRGNPLTYSRLATPLAFVSEDEVMDLLEGIVRVYGAYGDRSNRSHARLKYLIQEWGIEQFRSLIEELLGRALPPPRGIVPSDQPDYLGWSRQTQEGLNYVGVWIQNGRIRDLPGGPQVKSGLRAIVERFRPGVRFTAHHHVVLANIRDADIAAVDDLLWDHAILSGARIAPLRRLEMACPSFPFCPRALAEAERALPGLMEALAKAGFGDDDVVIRMSGCPNNCSRPRTAEIGLVGKGADSYLLFVGGSARGTRLNELLLEEVARRDIPAVLAVLLKAWRAERNGGERFGDWSMRKGPAALRERVGISLGAQRT